MKDMYLNWLTQQIKTNEADIKFVSGEYNLTNQEDINEAKKTKKSKSKSITAKDLGIAIADALRSHTDHITSLVAGKSKGDDIETFDTSATYLAPHSVEPVSYKYNPSTYTKSVHGGHDLRQALAKVYGLSEEKIDEGKEARARRERAAARAAEQAAAGANSVSSASAGTPIEGAPTALPGAASGQMTVGGGISDAERARAQAVLDKFAEFRGETARQVQVPPSTPALPPSAPMISTSGTSTTTDPVVAQVAGELDKTNPKRTEISVSPEVTSTRGETPQLPSASSGDYIPTRRAETPKAETPKAETPKVQIPARNQEPGDPWDTTLAQVRREREARQSRGEMAPAQMPQASGRSQSGAETSPVPTELEKERTQLPQERPSSSRSPVTRSGGSPVQRAASGGGSPPSNLSTGSSAPVDPPTPPRTPTPPTPPRTTGSIGKKTITVGRYNRIQGDNNIVNQGNVGGNLTQIGRARNIRSTAELVSEVLQNKLNVIKYKKS